jgi:hypothetical protein
MCLDPTRTPTSNSLAKAPPKHNIAKYCLAPPKTNKHQNVWLSPPNTQSNKRAYLAPPRTTNKQVGLSTPSKHTQQTVGLSPPQMTKYCLGPPPKNQQVVLNPPKNNNKLCLAHPRPQKIKKLRLGPTPKQHYQARVAPQTKTIKKYGLVLPNTINL